PSTTNMNFISGTLQRSGATTFTLLGTGTWSGGSITGAGTLSVDALGTLALSGGGAHVIFAGVTNLDGNLDSSLFTGFGRVPSINDGGIFNNRTGGRFVISNDFDTNPSGATGTFNNAGALSKPAGSGTSTFSLPFNNTGSVVISSGTLAFSGGGVDSGT